MKISKLQGGLGNQMFQYACARNLIRKNQKVYLDLNFIKKHTVSTSEFTARNYELNIFENCRIKILNKFQIDILHKKNLVYRTLKKLIYKKIKHITQKENEFIEIDPKIKNIYLDGYFQSEKYFILKRKSILDEFTFPILDNKNLRIQNRIINDQNSVSVHIRRGDYIKPHVLEYHGVLPMAYYTNAIMLLKSKFEKLNFYFFSDDIEFIKNNFGFIEEKVIVEGNIGNCSWKDMCLMKSCKHHIIANSSFSWWGAWLSETNGITYAPRNWFNPQMTNFEINDIVPNNWEIVDYE